MVAKTLPIKTRGANRPDGNSSSAGHLLRRARMLPWRLKLSLGLALRPVDFHGCGDQLVRVAPHKIRFDATSVLRKQPRAAILAGDWDQEARNHPLDAAAQPAGAAHEGPEIPVAIGRDGDLFAVDHALVVAHAQRAHLESVPIRVVTRHPQWLHFCKEFQWYAKTLPGGRAYQPCTHIDLADQPASWSNERFRIIQSCLQESGGRLVDIGANLGYFCHRAEEMGYACIAIEKCPRLAYFMERLRRSENRRFQVLCDSVLDLPFDEPVDVVLALNIFHHFIKKKASHQKLVEMLGRMQVREMIFQSHKPGEQQMKGVYRDYAPAEFVQFILDHSCLSSAELVGTDRDRPIYRLRAA